MPSSSSPTAAAPRYAPPDPTLPKPWRELIDGVTDNHYFWNPETGVTQYNRPRAALPPPPPGPPPRKRGRDDDRRPRDRLAYETGDVEGGASAVAYRRKHEIVVTGDDVPAPFMTFESTDFPAEMLREVHHAGFSVPTPIQAQSWPIALRSRDIVAVAKTGSGKTLGYLFPGFVCLKKLRNNNRAGPTVLVLAPTRELATQIQDEAEKFGRSSRISCTCLYGGAAKGPQLRDLSRGVDVVVATPGRLNDIIETRRISLHQVSYLVLDEADRMLDMGFEPQIRKIVKEIPHGRQTLMFTATWPKEVRKIAAELLLNPIQVNIGGTDMLVANKAITQHVEVTTPNEKQRRLEQILYSQDPGSKVLIFCSTKRMCDQLSWALDRKFSAAAIHGDKSQAERDRVLGQFRSGRSPILVATDVASRGLDIKDIRVVINYDFPTDIEDYVHRIGRTGRAGATGVSYTFFCKKDSNYASDLIKVLEGANQYVPPELEDMVRRGGRGRRSRGKARRWRSSPSARDRRLSRGGRNDSIYGGRGGRDMPSSGRSYGGRDIREDSDDEYSYRYRGLDLGIRNHHDTKNTLGTGIRSTRRHSRSRTVSLSPKRRRIGRSNSHCSSHSMSRSPSRGRIRSIGRSRSISRSISRSRSISCSISHSSKSFSDSRSRSISQGLGRAAGPARTPSPISKREPSTDHISNPVHSPTSYFDQQQKLAHAEQPDRSPSSLKGNSHSPNDCTNHGRGIGGGSDSPAQYDQKITPYQHGNDDAEKAGKLYVEKLPPGPNIDAEAGKLQVEKPPSCPNDDAEETGKSPVEKLRPCSNNGKDEEENGMIPEDQN